MVRFWLFRFVLLTISFHSFFFLPNIWARIEQNPAVTGEIPAANTRSQKILIPLIFKDWSPESQQDNPVPQITALAPDQATRGSDGVSLTITGNGFISSSRVYFNADPLPTNLIDENHLQATIPPSLLAAAGVFQVAVSNPPPQGGTSNTVPFTVTNPVPTITNPVPTITDLDPASAPAGTQGLTLILHGGGFLANTVISLRGQTRPILFFNGTQLRIALTPADLENAGVLEIVASNPAPGGGSSNKMSFTVVNPAPVLNSLSPNSVKAGSPDFILTLLGGGFARTAAVKFNNGLVSATWINSGRIEAPIPAGAIATGGSYPVVVFNPGPGCGSSTTLDFAVTPASNVAPLPDGAYGKQYEDLFPADATVPSYDPKRFALITGRVRDGNGDPLPGVAVSVQGHPEYGTGPTDSGGRYSLPVDGGGTVTAAYRKPGFLTAHRAVEVGWNTIAAAEDLVLVPEDAKATAITFDENSATIVTHTSSPITDASGRRSLTMVFSGDNRALAKDAQGNEQVVPQITVRATEFPTPESMPAKLPPTSAFTYCAELSVDGASSVRFEKPVVVYVDNFLGFAVGGVVPVGFYDRDRAVWVPADNGVVVRLLDTDNDGIVDAYTDGQNNYPAPGLTDPARFAPNSSFWRVEISHFTPWDCNWPAGPPADAIAPNPLSPPFTSLEGKPCELTKTNSYVENQSCIFHEDIPVPGTDLTLHYASNRTKGYKTRVVIPASGTSVPASLKNIMVKMVVAGRTFESTLPPGPNQSVDFVWDGLDYLGREVTGSISATISIGFVYQAFYYSSFDSIAPAFARAGNNVTGVWARQEITSWKQNSIIIYRGRTGVLGEGWTLSAHHYLDPADPDTLLKGDGSTVKHNILLIDTIAGNGRQGYSGDGGPAVQASFRGPSGVAVDSVGNIYIAEYYNSVIRKVEPSGIIFTIAGNGQNGFSGDGGPATQARLYAPRKIALDNAGNIYLVDGANHRIRKVDTSGIITTVAGKTCGWSGGHSGDGGPATQACLGDLVFDLALDSAGNMYIVDSRYNLIRKVDANGIITTIAGNGQYGYSGDGGPATLASLSSPRSVAVDDGGNLYIGEGPNSNRIRKVNTSGIISTFAGNGQTGFNVYSGDGEPAIQAGITSPSSLALDRVGNVYLSSDWHTRIRKVNTQGIITTVAGNNQEGFSGDGGPAVQANLKWPYAIALDSPGNIYVTDWGNERIRKVFRPGAFKSFVVAGDIVFGEENGLGYVMSNAGLHKSTIDLASGKTLLTFGYDQAHKLVSVTDRFGNQTTIQRSGSGAPLSITSPDGLVTRLTVEGNNQLTSVAYPDNGAYTFTYSPDGLLTEKMDPRGKRFGHQYDATGLITRVFDPEGGSWDFSRAVHNDGNVSVTLQTAEGNITAYQDRIDFTGAYTSVKTDPRGTTSTFFRSSDGLTETEQSSCGPSLTMKYDLDPAYKYKYLREFTQRSPAGLTQTATEAKTYEDTNGDAIPDRITRALNVNGRNWTTTNQTLTGTLHSTSPSGRTATLTYSPLTLLTQSVDVPGLFPVSYGYDSRGRPISATSGTRTTTISYDAQGHIGAILTPDQKTLRYTYDPMGRLKTQTLPDTTVIATDYDLNGNPTILTNPRGIPHTFDYTGVNQRKTLVAPLSGSYRYTYDKERRLKTVTFPSGKVITNIHTHGLLTSVEAPEGVTTGYTYNCSSLLGEATRGSEKVTYGYDGSFLTSDTRSGLLNQSIAYTYNNDFRLTSLSYGGVSTALAYDPDGMLTGVGAFTISRNAQNGLPEGLTDGTLHASRTFSGYGELDGITYTVGGSNKYSYTLTRDLAGRITRKVETIEGVPHTYDYTYDQNGRLTEVKKTDSVVESYSYDSNGNRTRETNTLKGVTNRAYTYSDEDQLLSVENDIYRFDADGFLTGKTLSSLTTGYLYSSRGELLEARLPDSTVITHDHDPLGRRIAKRVGGTITEKYLWANATTLLAVYDGSDHPIMRFNYGDERMPVSMTYNGGNYYLLYDSIGSLRAVTDTSGNSIKRIDYDSFGNIVVDTNSGFSVPFGFAGGLHDRATGLVRFGARDYDPAIGRWTAKDPIDFGGGDTNLFGYVGEDPVNWVDPEGLFPNWIVPPYGKYGGPGRSGPGEPIDSADECFREHDRGYERSGIKEWNKVESSRMIERKKCDREVANCLSKLPSHPLFWKKPPPWWMPIDYSMMYSLGAQALFRLMSR